MAVNHNRELRHRFRWSVVGYLVLSAGMTFGLYLQWQLWRGVERDRDERTIMIARLITEDCQREREQDLLLKKMVDVTIVDANPTTPREIVILEEFTAASLELERRASEPCEKLPPP